MPSWTGAAGVQYTVPFAGRGALTGRIDGSTHSTIYTAAQNSVYNRTPGYTIYNAHLTWEGPKGNWQISLEGKNLTESATTSGSSTWCPPDREPRSTIRARRSRWIWKSSTRCSGCSSKR